jgi:hypothetical protein
LPERTTEHYIKLMASVLRDAPPRRPVGMERTVELCDARLQQERAAMKVLVASAILALFAGAALPAFAQHMGEDPAQQMSGPEELAQKRREDAAEVEKAYKRTLKNTQSGTTATKTDPWGNIRGADTPSKNPK